MNTKIITTEKFWDCSCAIDYIHPAHVTFCPVCYDTKDDAPNSQVNTVLRYAGRMRLDKRTIQSLQEQLCQS